MMASY